GTGNLYGGIETALVAIARSAPLDPATTHEFATCFPGRLTDELVAAGRHVHDVGPFRYGRPWTIAKAGARLFRVLRSNRYDAVLLHGSWVYAALSPVVRMARTPVVYFQHDAPERLSHPLDRAAALIRPDLAIY